MERAWERVHSFAELTETELASRVRAAFPGAAVLQAERLPGGLRNSNYRLTLAGAPSPTVLRIYVADPGACARETAVLAAVAGRVPAPRVRHSEPSADPPFALLDWLEGEPLDRVLDDCDGPSAVALAAACGAALAAIHAIDFPAPGFLGSDLRVVDPMPDWASAVLSTLDGLVDERLGPELAASVRRAVESNRAAIGPAWSQAVLVHADYKPWNLLGRVDDAAGRRSAEPRLTGILDWEFACAGSLLIDFATFLRDEASRPAGYGDAFAAAYTAAGGTLPGDWRRLARLVDVLNLLQMLKMRPPSDEASAARLRDLVAAGLRETGTT
jgi:Ser/Thr protein kinase RdoA (MazF antagonist)